MLTFVKNSAMSDAELRKYRLTSLQEPSDELLAALMQEVAREVEIRSREASEKYFAELAARVQQQQQIWEDRLKSHSDTHACN